MGHKAMTGYSVNNRARYKCQYCDHRTYKSLGGMLNHLNSQHKLDYELALKDDEIARLKNRPAKVEVKERIVYRDPPAQPKKQLYWYRSVYCSTCKLVMTGAGIPVGQTIENTPHSLCGNRTLMLVTEIN